MMLPIDNKLKQPPNSAWSDPATAPANTTIVLTDAARQFIWLGSVSDESVPLPALEQMTGPLEAAYWALPQDQVEALS